MVTTRERSQFKHSFGQANHFLVTIIVGLNAIKVQNVAPPPDLPARWDPKSAPRSAHRSEAFAIQGTVVFLATALGEYLGDVARYAGPCSKSLDSALKAAAAKREGLRGRARAFADFSHARQSAEFALVESAILWRNRLVHPRSNARFNGELREALLAHAGEYETQYHHLDPELMIRSFEVGQLAPSMKEITGMVTAAHRFIGGIDSEVLSRINYEQHMEEVLRRHLFGISREQAQERSNRIWGRTVARAWKAIVSLARQNGFTDASADSRYGLTQGAIARLAELSPREALASFAPQSHDVTE